MEIYFTKWIVNEFFSCHCNGDRFSIGLYPSSFAQRRALVVLPIQGDPVMRTARNMFIPFFPGFLTPDFASGNQPEELVLTEGVDLVLLDGSNLARSLIVPQDGIIRLI